MDFGGGTGKDDNPPVTYAWKLCMGSIQCSSFKERVWWDGDNALLEERIPEGANSNASNSGIIGNIHGLTLDEPLAVIGSEPTRIINYNWRGQGMSSVFTDGTAGDISLGNTSTEVDWPASTQAETYFARSPDATSSSNPKRWLGTFVANGQGTTGMLYRRNRYFDPKSGQFTQADPIGIAGGMNAFGFAAGDPINFSDPFGLCPSCVGAGLSVASGWLIARLTDSDYTWKDAAVDAALGAAGAGLVGKLDKLGKLGRIAISTEAAFEEAGTVATAELRATHSVSRKAVQGLAADIEKNGIREPIKFVEHQGEKHVVDGNHRLRAARKLGIERVPAEEVKLPYKGYKTPGDLVYTRNP